MTRRVNDVATGLLLAAWTAALWLAPRHVEQARRWRLMRLHLQRDTGYAYARLTAWIGSVGRCYRIRWLRAR